MPAKSAESSSPSFEDAINELEALVETMESGDLSLDDSLKAFEQGVKLTRQCQQSLKAAEQKVMMLTEKSLDGELHEFHQDD